MGLSGCCCLVKYLLILINFVFWAVGVAAFALLGWVLTDTSFLLTLAEKGDKYYIGLLVFVGVATLILIIAFLGCCGALKESQCLLVTFFCFLLIVFVAEIATGVYAVLNQQQLYKMTRESVKKSIQEEYGVITSRTDIFDTFQSRLGCCGADGPVDWATSKYNNQTQLNLQISSQEAIFLIPKTCCKKTVDDALCNKEIQIKVGTSNVTSTAIYSKGCTDRVLEEIDRHLLIIIVSAAGILCVQIFALLISLCLCCAVGDREDVYKS